MNNLLCDQGLACLSAVLSQSSKVFHDSKEHRLLLHCIQKTIPSYLVLRKDLYDTKQYLLGSLTFL